MTTLAPPSPPPLTWLITSALTPFGHAIAVRALQRGDNVALGCSRAAVQSAGARDRLEKLQALGGPRAIAVEVDIEVASTLQSAVAQLMITYTTLDVLLLPPPAHTHVAALEDTTPAATTAAFSASYFGPLNALRVALPTMRRQARGHIVLISSLTGAMGTPGLAVRSAADHALEGLLDALMFEVAPFGVRVSVVQPGVEVAALMGASTVSVAKGVEEYGTGRVAEMRSLAEGVMGVKNSMRDVGMEDKEEEEEDVLETVDVVMGIAGIENPPARITVGADAVELVKERLKTLSEELEEYLEASLGADIVPAGGGGGDGGRGKGKAVAVMVGDDD